MTSDDPVQSNTDEVLEAKRSLLQSFGEAYMTKNYRPENSACGVFSKDGKLVVVMSSEKPNMRNYWSGKWSSSWTIQVNGSAAVIGGEIKVGLS